MGALAYGMDSASNTAVTGASILTAACSVFPPAYPLSQEMTKPAGGPGSMIEGSQGWLEGSQALQRAGTAVRSTADSISAEVWSGGDRDMFDTAVDDLVAQLDAASTYAEAVGVGLAGLSGPLLAVPPACVTMSALVFAELLTFEAAVASVVGNLGASEAAYAAGCATAASCLSVMTGITIGVAVAMSAAAAALAIGTGVDVHEQDEHGDTAAIGNYVKAEVVGLAEFGEDALFSYGAGKAADRATRGLVPRNPLEKTLKDVVNDKIADRLGDANDAGIDLVKGNPGDALKDLSGYGDEIDAAEDIFGDDDPPNDHQTDRYSLPAAPPPPPPVVPIPPAGDEPNAVPIPNYDGEDVTVVPAGADINSTGEGRPA